MGEIVMEMELIIIGDIKVYRDITTGKIVVHQNSLQSKELTEEQESLLVEFLKTLGE